MADVVSMLGFIALGLTGGFLIFTGILAYYVKKGYDSIPRGKSKGIDPSVTARLKEAGDMTKEQNDIMTASSQPSSNALHSRHKNGLIARYKELEKLKMEVLTSIIKEGHDPMVTVFNAQTNQNEELPLSQFLNAITGNNKVQETKPEVLPPTIESDIIMKKVEKNGRTFFVISGGKSTSNH